MGANFRGVLIFVDFIGSLHPQKTVAWAPCTHACSSYMPRKYKPSKLSYLFKPRKFKPSKISAHTVSYVQYIGKTACYVYWIGLVSSLGMGTVVTSHACLHLRVALIEHTLVQVKVHLSRQWWI